jgi:hypothetical protein
VTREQRIDRLRCRFVLVIDMSALQMVLAVLIGWLDRHDREALAYLIEETRLLCAQLGGTALIAGTPARTTVRFAAERAWVDC